MEKSKKTLITHFIRFFRGLSNGMVFFVGSSEAEVHVQTINMNGKNFIQANYVVHNTTSLKSLLYHLISESQNSRIWKLDNCDFPYNLPEVISCPTNPFICIPSIL